MNKEVTDGDDGARVVRRARRQVAGAILVAAISVAGAVGSILGQGVAYRQMRAIEDIAQRMRAEPSACSCAPAPEPAGP